MTKKFDNVSEDGIEKALRRGYSVPEGAVNLAWVKSPRLTPENNVIIIDTSKTTAENQNLSPKRKKLAFANALGILEDENGNQIWSEEYPIISDVFTVPEEDIKESDYTDETVLPFVHVSRHFHIDFAGLAYNSLDEYVGSGIKVVDKNGIDYTDAAGNKRYKINIVEATGANFPQGSRQSAYRVYAFVDTEIEAGDLYLTYDKVELNTAGGVKNQEINFKELVNPRSYFQYTPEETDVIDHSNSAQKIFSSKPSNIKQQILGLPQPNFYGWKYYVPRKAIPDPRIFQIFQWRLACEFTQPVVPENAGNNIAKLPTTTINVGVVIPSGGNHLHTRANFFFYELNQSDYNFSKINFVNPLSEGLASSGLTDKAQEQADYWHVDISTVTYDQLNQFDILLWAPSAPTLDISAYAPKINYFTEALGKTFIFETSSGSTISGIPDISFSPILNSSLINPSTTDTVNGSTLRLYDATVEDSTDTFNSFGMWKVWPPNVSDILNQYTDTGSILASADVIAGWALDDADKTTISGYRGITDSKFQYISSYETSAYRPVLEAFDSQAEKTYLRVDTDNVRATTPDATSLDITGDISIVCRVSLDHWISGDYQTLVAKWGTTGLASYMFDIEPAGNFRLAYDGSLGIDVDVSTAVPPLTNGTTYWVKASLDVNNGAAGRTCRFYYAPDSETEPTSWTQIGSDVVTAGVYTINSGTQTLSVGGRVDLDTFSSKGNFYRVIIRPSLLDVATGLFMDFTKQVAGSLTGTASTGQVFTFSTVNSLVSVFKPSWRKTVLHKRFNSGGNIFISTACLFEDHLFQANGNMASRSLQIEDINNLSPTYFNVFREMVSSQDVEGEMKLRVNTMLFATLNKPAPDNANPQALTGSNKGNAQSITVYSDWQSSWTIDPNDGVLSEEEKSKFNFVLLPTKASDTSPTWQRLLSDKNVKQIIQEKINQIDSEHKDPLYNGFEGASKRYFIISTNPLVQVFTTENIKDATVPTAWTEAYSPAFSIPTHLGSYVVRDEMIAGKGQGDGKRIYPAKGYNLQSSVSYLNTSNVAGSVTAIVTLKGTAKKTIKAPDQTVVRKTWIPATPGKTTDIVLHWNTDGANKFENIYKQQWGYPKPVGMDLWTSANYGIRVPNNWPFSGLHGTLSVNGGDRGVLVRVVQEIVNTAIFFGKTSGPSLKVDGIYGNQTANGVRRFQLSQGAKYIDGIVDAETWSLLSFALITFSNIPGYKNDFLAPYIANAKRLMMLHSISDDKPGTVFTKQSWQSNGPSSISEGFMIRFNESLPIYKVSIMPYLAGTATNNLTINWLDVAPRTTLYKYDFSNGFPGPITGKSGGDGDWININIFPTKSNSVVFRAKQTGHAGWGSARMIGIRDVAVYAKKFVPGVPGHYTTSTTTIPGGTFEEEVDFDFTAQIQFQSGIVKSLSPLLGTKSIGGTISDIKWDTTSLVISPGSIGSFFDYSFTDVTDATSTVKNVLNLTYNGTNNAISAEYIVKGSKIGDGTVPYRTKDESGVIDQFVRAYGWIQKDQGLRLICKEDGSPFGFPAALPSQVTYSTHFARYRLDAFGTDQTVYYGFYDVNEKEFLTNAYGEPEVTYYDYVRRGPQNIYIAVKTTYELDSNNNVPGATDVAMHPFKWAMPVYGVTSSLKSKIQIDPLSPDLGMNDLWSIPIRSGSFSKTIPLRSRDKGSLSSYLKNYQGTNINAFYAVPEAKNGPWSNLYGRPYVDIKGEVPIVVDDSTIQVRQFPILLVQTPTSVPSIADPWFPIFKVYKRQDLSSAWMEVPFTDIKDYNVLTGTITLKDNLVSTDPRLVKVDYTSNRSVYNMKNDGSTKINLNPYLSKKSELVNKPIYVYILPEYITDSAGNLISNSVQTRTVHITTSQSIFNENQVDYDPTAVLLGIIYISNAADINDVTILDTRKRGGGVHTSYDNGDILEIQPESESYWDIIPDNAVSYQKGGYVIVRLPSDLKNDFTLEQIYNIIERNLTVGVRYQVEDLQGNRWQQ